MHASGRLLDQLLRQFTGLRFSPPVLRALYMGLCDGSTDEAGNAELEGTPPGAAAAHRAGTLQRLLWVCTPLVPAVVGQNLLLVQGMLWAAQPLGHSFVALCPTLCTFACMPHSDAPASPT